MTYITTLRQAEANSSCAVTSSPEPDTDGGEVNTNPIREVREDLGTQVFEGLQAKGTRWTHTTPTGAVGNDSPLVEVEESWRAISLPLTVREVIDDPRTGKMIRMLTRFTAGEPDLKSFDPPEGYEIIEREPHSVGCVR